MKEFQISLPSDTFEVIMKVILGLAILDTSPSNISNPPLVVTSIQNSQMLRSVSIKFLSTICLIPAYRDSWILPCIKFLMNSCQIAVPINEFNIPTRNIQVSCD
jgi:hypothetical protein